MATKTRGKTPLSIAHPDLAKEWDFAKNTPLSPSDVPYGCGKKFWWIGSECGHSFDASVLQRSRGSKCPYCSNPPKRVLKGFNDLATIYPSIASEWHPTKNGDLLPSDVLSRSNKHAWWLCKNGHEWPATISNRTRERSSGGCPYCSGRKVLKGYNDLATTHPLLAQEWHPVKNGDLTPDMVTKGYTKKVFWRCKLNHEWEENVQKRTSRNFNCPYCSNNRVLPGFNDLQTKFPDIAKSWHPTKNGQLKPSEVLSCSDTTVWWICEKGHEWPATINNRTNKVHKRGCPECRKELHTSFPEQAIYYYVKTCYPDALNSDKTAIGLELDIYIPTIKTAIEYDGSHWHRKIKHAERDIVKNNRCFEKGIRLIRVREEKCEYNNCICIVRNSEYSNEDLSQIIRQLFCIIDANLDIDVDVVRDEKKIKGQYILSKKENSLAARYPDIAKEWHPNKNGILTPDMFSYSSNHKAWWRCECGFEWEARINSRVKNKPRCKKCNLSKPVLCIETNTAYASIKDATNSTGINGGRIGECCKGKSKTAGGYHWRYVNE